VVVTLTALFSAIATEAQFPAADEFHISGDSLSARATPDGAASGMASPDQAMRASAAEESQSIRVIVSSQEGVRRLSAERPLIPGPVRPTRLPIIEVDLSKRRQSILGLGASLEHATCENLSKLPLAQREEVVARLVSPTTGIGMNLMRLCIGTSDFVGESYYTYDDLPAGETDPELNRFSIERDRAYVLPTIKLALRQNPDLLFFASPWSPPAWMKTSGKLGTGRVRPGCYAAYALYLLKFIQAYQAEGVPIYAITVQNEPQHQDAAYPTTIWTAEEQRDFIRDHLGPLFERHGVKTLIWCWDHNWNKPGFPRTILSDPRAARYVDGTAFHHYEGKVEAQSAFQREFPDKHIYFTEGSVFGTLGALQLIDILRHDARSYNAWVIMLDEHRRPNRGPHDASATCIELLDDGSVRYNDDYSMQGQFMKFIRRGAIRLESAAPRVRGFGHVAFLNPDGHVVLIAANAGAVASGFAVNAGGRQFETELPAKSVATYVWKSGR